MTMAAKQHILIIDDDVDLLTTLGDFLDLEGYDVSSAINGENGLEELAKYTPDLIMLDISMPGMGGVAFLTEISSRSGMSDIPVCVFTARANMEEFFGEVDVAGFLAKPCDPNVLLSEIRRILATRPASPAPPTVEEAPRALISRKVMLAEDEGGRRDTLIRALAAAGYHVTAVADGSELVEKTIVAKPDVIVAKLVLKNMNGDAAADMLKGMPTTRSIPVLLYDDTGSSPRVGGFTDEGSRSRRFIRSSKPDAVLNSLKDIFAPRPRHATPDTLCSTINH